MWAWQSAKGKSKGKWNGNTNTVMPFAPPMHAVPMLPPMATTPAAASSLDTFADQTMGAINGLAKFSQAIQMGQCITAMQNNTSNTKNANNLTGVIEATASLEGGTEVAKEAKLVIEELRELKRSMSSGGSNELPNSGSQSPICTCR